MREFLGNSQFKKSNLTRQKVRLTVSHTRVRMKDSLADFQKRKNIMLNEIFPRK